MKMLVMGCSKHLKGVSKRTGNPYDFYNLQLVWRDPSLKGFAARAVSIDPEIYNFFIDSYLNKGGKFPAVSDVGYSPDKELLSIDFISDSFEDVSAFIKN